VWQLRSPGPRLAALRDNPIRAEALALTLPRIRCCLCDRCGMRGIGGTRPHWSISSSRGSSAFGTLFDAARGHRRRLGTLFGPVLGSVVVVLLPEWLRFLQDWYPAIFGLR
jgi:hypothetical protein